MEDQVGDVDQILRVLLGVFYAQDIVGVAGRAGGDGIGRKAPVPVLIEELLLFQVHGLAVAHAAPDGGDVVDGAIQEVQPQTLFQGTAPLVAGQHLVRARQTEQIDPVCPVVFAKHSEQGLYGLVHGGRGRKALQVGQVGCDMTV